MRHQRCLLRSIKVGVLLLVMINKKGIFVVVAVVVFILFVCLFACLLACWFVCFVLLLLFCLFVFRQCTHPRLVWLGTRSFKAVSQENFKNWYVHIKTMQLSPGITAFYSAQLVKKTDPSAIFLFFFFLSKLTNENVNFTLSFVDRKFYTAVDFA